MRHRWGLLSLGLVLCAWLVPAHALAQTSIGLSGSFFYDDGDLSVDERLANIPREQLEQEVSNARVLDGALTFLYDLDGENAGFRLGGELRYFGTYAASWDDDDREQRFELGTLMEIGFRGEWVTQMSPEIAVALGLRVDVALLLPSGDFAEEARRLENEGVPTSDGPRVGWTIAPMVGVRYQLIERLHARLDLGFGWTRTSLFDIDEVVQGIRFVRDDTVSATRVEVTLGVELSL